MLKNSWRGDYLSKGKHERRSASRVGRRGKRKRNDATRRRRRIGGGNEAVGTMYSGRLCFSRWSCERHAGSAMDRRFRFD